MGRLNLNAQRVHKYASQLLETNRISAQPPWYDTIGTIPPSARLVRPPLQHSRKPGKKASRLFSPVKISYEEDKLRWEYFNDHPWELARPRVVLENDGRDRERWDWSHPLCRPDDGALSDQAQNQAVREWEVKQQTSQASRPLNGESVVQRQHWLTRYAGLSQAAAYDKARKELYRARHAREVEQRVAKEEAMAYGAFFGASPLEVGMQLEDQQYENWREWAAKEVETLKQIQGSAYTGLENDAATPEVGAGEEEELQQVSDQIPASREGQMARGGVAVHP